MKVKNQSENGYCRCEASLAMIAKSTKKREVEKAM
jgi:hypothetical protein